LTIDKTEVSLGLPFFKLSWIVERPAPSGVAAFESEKCAESVQAISAAPQNKPSGDSSRGLFYCLEPLAIPSIRERAIPKNKGSWANVTLQ
jgi:hypothetical protein